MTDSLQPYIFFNLLANELRWNLLSHLARSDFRVQELVALLGKPQNLVSYHLKMLREIQLVIERHSNADARDIYYSLDVDYLQALYQAAGKELHPALIMNRASGFKSEALRILFLCTENSARSQLAEGLLRFQGGKNIQAFSAGSTPTKVHPYAIQAATEMGIDISEHYSKHVDEFRGQDFDYVITVCDLAREKCPVFFGGAQYIHWSLPDPVAAGDYGSFQAVVHQIQRRVEYFLLQNQLIA